MNLADAELDAGTRAWIARIEQIAPGIPDIANPDPAVQRRAAQVLSDRLAVEFTLPVPDGVELDDLELAGLRARRYRPAAADGAQPTQLWLHGGGFYAGTIDEILNDRLCARRALDSGVQIISLEYRLTPEHPYPAQVEDARTALDALLTDPAGHGVDARRVGIGGNSAGAAIAASTSLHLRDAGDSVLMHVDLEVPPTALRAVGDSGREFAHGFGLDEIELLARMYAGPHGPADGYLAPLDAPDLSGLPPHLILVAEYDPLRDGGVAYADRLRAAGVDVDLYLGAGQLHGSPGQTAASAGALAWQTEHSRRLGGAYRTR
jgi:acetyl esterase